MIARGSAACRILGEYSKDTPTGVTTLTGAASEACPVRCPPLTKDQRCFWLARPLAVLKKIKLSLIPQASLIFQAIHRTTILPRQGSIQVSATVKDEASQWVGSSSTPETIE